MSCGRESRDPDVLQGREAGKTVQNRRRHQATCIFGSHGTRLGSGADFGATGTLCFQPSEVCSVALRRPHVARSETACPGSASRSRCDKTGRVVHRRLISAGKAATASTVSAVIEVLVLYFGGIGAPLLADRWQGAAGDSPMGMGSLKTGAAAQAFPTTPAGEWWRLETRSGKGKKRRGRQKRALVGP
jgi:hypothetical protein